MKLTATILFFFPVLGFAETCTGKFLVELDKVELNIEQRLFVPSNHSVEYYDGGNGTKIPDKIDGIKFIPNDFDLPYCEVIAISATFNGENYKLEATGLYDFWNSRYTPKSIDFVSCTEKGCTIKTVMGDGAGTFLVGWVFGSGSPQQYLLTQDESAIFSFNESIGK